MQKIRQAEKAADFHRIQGIASATIVSGTVRRFEAFDVISGFGQIRSTG